MKNALGTVCGAVLLTGLLTAPAMAQTLWRSNLVCDVNGDGMFSDLSPQRPFAVIQDRGELYVSNIYGLPPITPLTCLVNCFLGGSFHSAPCGATDANGRLSAQRTKGFLPPGLVCAGVDFFLFDTATGGGVVLCVDGAVIPQ